MKKVKKVATTRIPSSVSRVAAHGKRAAFFGRLLRPAEGGPPIYSNPGGKGANATEAEYSEADIVYCHNHIERDVELKIKKQKDHTPDDVKVLKHSVRQLLDVKKITIHNVRRNENEMGRSYLSSTLTREYRLT